MEDASSCYVSLGRPDREAGVTLLWVRTLFRLHCRGGRQNHPEIPQEAGSPAPEAEASPCSQTGETELGLQLKAKALCLVTELETGRCHPVFCTPEAPGVTAGPLRQSLMQLQHRKKATMAYGQAEGSAVTQGYSVHPQDPCSWQRSEPNGPSKAPQPLQAPSCPEP